MRVYLDNAATTPLDPEVFEAMKPYMLNLWGNPSSIHSHGREVRSAIEKARKKVAELLQAAPAEIFFTSGGTEADNMALRCTTEATKVRHVISSPTEHHAVLHTLQHMEKAGQIRLHLLELDSTGSVSLDHLEQLLKAHPGSLVSLMHGNNEIGNLLDLERVSALCQEYKAPFHSDTVQTMGHYAHNLSRLTIQHLVGSAHKFHGPKGVGFLYINAGHKIHPLLHGGAQERNMRGGTENVYGIIGLAKALEIAYRDMEKHKRHISGLKQRMIDKLKQSVPGVGFNGNCADLEGSLYTVLNVSLPPTDDNDMLLFNLDINGISASGGSACSSGSSIGSHVLQAIKCDPSRGAVRFSFSKYTTPEEIDYAVEKLAEQYRVEA
ncbi:cysteine desulfurase family protein [Cesiribacter andamanensis]|uniref:Cysteine desulfurase n=1 Tax=Cesiribacter andamanensis AMV16 TaxID=1279009 RepID=M7NR85_9BACT|nr:cysteine desulfurase family protein [Cesiribacter andamanensis]EMR04220.1 Cysteine desulfurase [Cesiribacter andamanensis AMV16]